MIEMADKGLDIATLGFGTLAKAVTAGGVKAAAGALAKEGAAEVAETALRKFGRLLRNYGVNILSEGAEEAAQEFVSVEAEKEAMRLAGLTRNTTTAADRERIWNSAKAGMAIAGVLGGATLAGNTVLEHQLTKPGGQVADVQPAEAVTPPAEAQRPAPLPTPREMLAQRLEDNRAQLARNEARQQEWERQQEYIGWTLSHDGPVYGYNFMVSRPDMQITELPDVGSLRGDGNKVDRNSIAEQGLENAATVGRVAADGRTYVKNNYTGRELRVDTNSMRHGLDGPPIVCSPMPSWAVSLASWSKTPFHSTPCKTNPPLQLGPTPWARLQEGRMGASMWPL